jgi:hypothetical protein
MRREDTEAYPPRYSRCEEKFAPLLHFKLPPEKENHREHRGRGEFSSIRESGYLPA